MRQLKTEDLIIKETKNKGRGVFANKNFEKGNIIEVCPVVILSEKDRSKIDDSSLYDYYFGWEDGKAAIALGFGSLYNHSFKPNADYEKDFENKRILFKAIGDIKEDEEILVDYTQGGKEDDLWFDLG